MTTNRKHVCSRRDTVLLNILCIGHTRLTHSYVLSGDDLPECGTCQCPLTVKHILVALPLKIYFIVLKHVKSLILLKKLVFISNFNVFILMFVSY